MVDEAADEAQTVEEMRSLLESATRAREVLLAGVAHDLRNPLNTFAMSAGLLREDLEGPEIDRARALSLLTRMDRAAARMQWLIDDLLEASRVEARAVELDLQPAPIAALLELTAEKAKPTLADKGAALVVRPPPEGAVTVDRARVAQALVKVVAVALKSTGEGATVTLGADATDGAVAFEVVAAARSSAKIAHDESRSGLALLIARGLLAAHQAALATDTSAAGTLKLTATFKR